MRFLLSTLIILITGAGGSPAFADEGIGATDESPGVTSRWGFGGGVGLATEWHREVNPDYREMRWVPELYGQVRYSRYALVLEYQVAPTRRSTSGGLSITSDTATLGAWGRYLIRDAPTWQPFVSLGGGVHSDEVSTSFQGRTVGRTGTRRFLGLGGGVSTRIYRFVTGETEARVTSEEASRRYGVSLLLRLGVTF